MMHNCPEPPSFGERYRSGGHKSIPASFLGHMRECGGLEIRGRNATVGGSEVELGGAQVLRYR